jgi:hypothetical protein
MVNQPANSRKDMRGLYKYRTAAERWWACAEAVDGVRVNIVRGRYELMRIDPPFEQLPLEPCRTAAEACPQAPQKRCTSG